MNNSVTVVKHVEIYIVMRMINVIPDSQTGAWF